jgi:hypothetical protein
MQLSGTAVRYFPIIFLMSDDQGYEDVSAFNPHSKIKTPAIDGLAKEGMVFTDAHSASAVCTPTRYGVLTGRYPWRTRLQKWVLSAKTSVLPDGSISVGDEPLIDDKTLIVGGPIERVFDKYWEFHHARQMGTWIEQDTVTVNAYFITPCPNKNLP